MSLQRSFKVEFAVLLYLFSLTFLCFTIYGSGSSSGNAAIAKFEPALAVRASACITCHAKIHPSYITDFGHGDPYFFGIPVTGGKFGPFDGSIYGDFYGGEPNKTGWLTAEIDKQIIVPKAHFDFNLSAAGAKLADQPAYRQALQSASLAEYLAALEKQKPNPATVTEKKEVFIGAPSAATLEERFKIAPGSATKFKYIKNDNSSPEIEGIGLSPGSDFYTNTREVVCDGDLFIRGPLFLDHMALSTKNGCRIYSTGPVFLQHGITYKFGGPASNSNLQLVSAQAILLGVGDKSCATTDKDSPLSRRLVSGYAVSTFFTREANGKSLSPQTLGKNIYDQGKRIPSLEDATCHDDTISFSRLLLNAPQVHSRYKGPFRGLVIAEVALFRLSKSTFEFDPVFKRVPILPVLRDSDYLQVK